MRNSQQALLTALGVVVVAAIVAVGAMRFVVSSVANADQGPGNDRSVANGQESRRGSNRRFRDSTELTTETMDFSGFDRVLIQDSWVVELTRGDDWNVELTFPEDRARNLEVAVRGNQLVLIGEGQAEGFWRIFGGDNREYRAVIAMPTLAAIEVEGFADVGLAGFDGEHLALTISGAGNIEGEDAAYESLAVTISGAANVDLSSMPVTDADVTISGASNVELAMNGGELTGNLSGVGNLTYSGSVTSEDVNVSGLAHVGRD